MADDVKIEINIDKISWGDMRLMFGLQNGNSDPMVIADLFDRFVVGGADAVPIARTMEVMEALTEAMEGIANPKNLSSASTPTSGRTKKRRSNTSS